MNHNDCADGPPGRAEYPDEPHHVVREDAEPSELGPLVVEAIADAMDIDPMSADVPISRSLDPDALNNLFAEHEDGEPRNGGQVSLRLWGMVIAVHSEGQVVVYPPEYEHSPVLMQ